MQKFHKLKNCDFMLRPVFFLQIKTPFRLKGHWCCSILFSQLQKWSLDFWKDINKNSISSQLVTLEISPHFYPLNSKKLTLKNKALQLWYTSHMVGTQIILTSWKSSPFRSLAHRGALCLPPTSEKVVVAMNWTHHCVWQRNTEVVNFTAWEEISSFGQNKLLIFLWSFRNLTGHKAEKFKDKGPGNMTNVCQPARAIDSVFRF